MKLIKDYLDRRASENPDKTAFVDKDSSVTFKELRDRAKRLSCTIIDKDIFKQPVAIIMPESVSLIEACLGVVCSGNYYISINPEYPANRISIIIKELQPKLIIALKSMYADISSHVDKIFDFDKTFEKPEIVFFEDMLLHKINGEAIERIANQIIDSDLMYINFTSGSTGIPKGVSFSYKSAIYRSVVEGDRFCPSENTVIGNHFSMFFTASTYVIYASLIKGATCLLGMGSLLKNPVEWAKLMCEHKVDYIHGTPAIVFLIRRLMDSGYADPSYIRNIMMAGSSQRVCDIRPIMTTFQNAEIYSAYGMSELGGISHIVNIRSWMNLRERNENDCIPMGRPMSNTSSFILDINGNIANHDEKGEVYVRFSGISSGYYLDLKKTNEVIVQNPQEARFRDIVVKTGDIAVKDEDGFYYHYGRIDHMIKKHGVRIELGEIEKEILLAGAAEGVCVFIPERELLVAFFSGDVSEKEVFLGLHNVLPVQMMPDRIVKMEKMPLNQNGKYDRTYLIDYTKNIYKI